MPDYIKLDKIPNIFFNISFPYTSLVREVKGLVWKIILEVTSSQVEKK